MVKNSSLRNRASNLSLRLQASVQPQSQPAHYETLATMPDKKTAASWAAYSHGQSAYGGVAGGYQSVGMANVSSARNYSASYGVASQQSSSQSQSSSTTDASIRDCSTTETGTGAVTPVERLWNDNVFSHDWQRAKLLGEAQFQARLLEGMTDSVRHRFDPLPARQQAPVLEETPAEVKHKAIKPEEYTKPFCDFLTENPTIFHAVDYFKTKLEANGFQKLSERSLWTSELENGGKYFVERNGSSMIAFIVGNEYKSGNGVAMVAGHIDAVTARLKPVSTKRTTAGYVQLGVAPYAGGLNATWWDRDLGIGGRVLVKDFQTGKITTRLVKLGWPIARIPSLAPHFGIGIMGQQNPETQAVPIIGLDNSGIHGSGDEKHIIPTILGGVGSFVATQPPRLVRAIAGELQIQDYSSIVNWELELFDIQPATVGGLDKEFIFAGRIDDKLCSWAAMEGLLASTSSDSSGIIKLVGLFDDEEIGSLLRQGARGNFLPTTIERICEALSEKPSGANVVAQTYANSFLVSADVTHAVNPNFVGSYLEGHAPRLNVGLVIAADGNGHMTTDSVSTALLTQIAEKSSSKLQVFMIRNDSRSGGTVGPMLSSAMGVRAVDAGLPQLSMHSIRATTGSLDPGLGVQIFAGFFSHFEEVDQDFE